MDEKRAVIKKAVSSFKYTFLAQVIALVLSVIKSILLPKILPIDEYGYWQIYVLYSTYVGIFMLGFNDGVYLVYGKYQYKELPFKKLRAADKWYIGMLLMFSVTAGFACVVFTSSQRLFSLLGVSIDIFLMGINGLLIYVLQITNQMKAYSLYTVLDKIVMLMAILCVIFSPKKDYRLIIFADVISKFVVSVGLVIKCKEMFIGESESIGTGFCEFVKNIKVGISLMFAQLMGQLLTGIGRFIIDLFGDIKDYAFYSFGITITNLVLVFITSLSLVLYPTLKRLPENEYKRYFKTLNNGVVLFGYIAIGLYFLGVIFVKCFLQQYAPVLAYLHILFCVIILQAKIQLVLNTFYKVLREEKAMLIANTICIVTFLVFALILYMPSRNITSIAVCTLIATAVRCFYSETYIRKTIRMEMDSRICFEVAFVSLFAALASFLNYYLSLVVYIVLLLVALSIYKPEINDLLLAYSKIKES